MGHHQPRPDREGAAVSDRLGQPDHARRHRRRGLLDDLRDDRVAPRARRDLGRRQRRPGQRHARQRQDLEERHAEGSGRRAHPDHRGLAAHEGPRLHRRLPLHARARSQAVHLPHRQLRRDLDAADRRQERHPDRSPDARRSARIREQAGLLYAGGEFGFFVSFNGGKNWQPLQQNLPATPITDIKVHRNDLVDLDDGAVGVDHGQHHAAAAAGGGSRTAAAGNRWQLRLQRARRRADASCRRWRCSSRAKPSAIAAAPRRSRTSSPEYPFQGAQFDLYFATAPGADTKLEVLDAGGARAAHLERGAAEERRRAGAGHARTVLPRRRRLHRASAPKPACSASRGTCATPARGRRRIRPAAPGGPMVPPGKYSVRLTAGGQTITRTFELRLGSARRRRRRDRCGDRRAGEVPAAGARRHQRRAQAPGESSSRRCRRPA